MAHACDTAELACSVATATAARSTARWSLRSTAYREAAARADTVEPQRRIVRVVWASRWRIGNKTVCAASNTCILGPLAYAKPSRVAALRNMEDIWLILRRSWSARDVSRSYAWFQKRVRFCMCIASLNVKVDSMRVSCGGILDGLG